MNFLAEVEFLNVAYKTQTEVQMESKVTNPLQMFPIIDGFIWLRTWLLCKCSCVLLESNGDTGRTGINTNL